MKIELEINVRAPHLEALLNQVLTKLTKMEVRIMAGQKELGDKIAELGSVVTDLGVDLQAALDKLKGEIANGVDTSASIASLQGIIDQVKGFDATAEAESGTHTDPVPPAGQ